MVNGAGPEPLDMPHHVVLDVSVESLPIGEHPPTARTFELARNEVAEERLSYLPRGRDLLAGPQAATTVAAPLWAFSTPLSGRGPIGILRWRPFGESDR